ncbi:MAG: GNAT family N-acetyltransferase [Acidimicrobiales bacterium]
MRFELPVPDLVDEAVGIRLRAWRGSDAEALAAAWHDEDIARYCGVPARAERDVAGRWIAGWDERADAGSALDLAVADVRHDRVLGEVGISPFPAPGVLELGWWVGPADRGRGVATAAVGLVADWAASTLAPARLVVRIPPGHLASERVATAAGFARRGRLDADHDLWTRPRERFPRGATLAP